MYVRECVKDRERERERARESERESERDRGGALHVLRREALKRNQLARVFLILFFACATP